VIKMNTIDKDEILKTSKWIRFLFMVLYAFVINFALTISIGLAFIQFLFVLFTSKTNASISNINSYVLEFFNDSLMFLLFQTEEKPFPFKNSSSDEGTVIDAETEESEEASDDNEAEQFSQEEKS
tara:strand:+ start:225 stop:599 length:375 start_codon:yes stop_codon:yes gene_type:complete